MTVYRFILRSLLDHANRDEFIASVCWDHCQMFYQPIYEVKCCGVANGATCPFCAIQQAKRRPRPVHQRGEQIPADDSRLTR